MRIAAQPARGFLAIATEVDHAFQIARELCAFDDGLVLPVVTFMSLVAWRHQ